MIIGLPIGKVGSNTYLVYDEEGGTGVVVDPGGKLEPLLVEIERHDVEVRYVLNTHAHFDHIAANAKLLAALDVPLGLHPDDEELLTRGGGAEWFNTAYVPSPKPELDLTDGRVLEVGDLHLEVVHTPGHTPGSICLYVREDEALLTGDTLFRGSVGRTDLPGGDARQLTASLRHLLTLPAETKIYPGHGPTTTLERERNANPWLRRLKGR